MHRGTPRADWPESCGGSRVFIDQVSNAGALPTLRAMLSFASQRQQLIAHNIANLETPNFQPVDVSPQTFQAALADAVDERRSRNGGMCSVTRNRRMLRCRIEA